MQRRAAFWIPVILLIGCIIFLFCRVLFYKGSPAGSSLLDQLTSFRCNTTLTYGEGTYKTVLSAETITLADGSTEMCYRFHTELSIPVTYTLGEETKSFDDAVRSDVWFRDAKHSLQPVKSEKYVLSHTPMQSSAPSSVDSLYTTYEYTYTVTYNADLTNADTTATYTQPETDPITQAIELSDYMETTTIPRPLLKQKIQDALASLTNPVYRGIIGRLFEEYEKPFYDYPAAAKNHHSFVGGLAEHVTGMLDLANEVVRLYPMLDRELLISGIMVHDLGKLTELSGPVVTEYTLQGKLLGHISIMQAKIAEVADQLGFGDSEEALLLRHMVLSHHGQHEFGSPVLPLVAEAEVLHMIDNLDARMNTLEKAYAQTEEGSFTPRLFPMENRAFYKPKKRQGQRK